MSQVHGSQVTRVVEDYVTLIWKAFEWPGGAPSTTDLAAQLGVTPSTVSATLKKLARDGFIDYEPYGAIELTDAGRRVAVEIVRRHRILETYLHEKLGMSWDEVHVEADRLEHAVSDVVLARMDAALGHPSSDPHGDPIPDAVGSVVRDQSVALAESATGTVVRVVRVSDRSPDVLRHLHQLGVVIGAELCIDGVSAAADAVAITVAGASVQLSLQTAAAVRVAPAS